MNTRHINIFLGMALLLLLGHSALAQEPIATATPDETVKVATEEVKLNVMARNSFGRFVSTLKPDDLLIVEEGTPQTITSMRRVSANVLFLLDTGGDLNFAKNVMTTKITAKVTVNNLSAADNIAVIQYSDKIETVAAWTKDHSAVFDSLDKRLISGKRSRFSEALNAAVTLFHTQPLENRHLVLISDGLESVANDAARQTALQNILAANITIHVISYTQMEQLRAQKASQRVTFGKGDTKPRVPTYIYDEMLKSLPVAEEVRRFLKTQNESQHIVVISLDKERIKFIRGKRDL